MPPAERKSSESEKWTNAASLFDESPACEGEVPTPDGQTSKDPVNSVAQVCLGLD